MTATWYDQNDHALTLTGLQNGVTQEWVNDATVLVTMYDSSGAQLSGITWPVTLSHVAGSNGNYQAVIDKGLVVSVRDRIAAKFTASVGELDATWEEQLRVTKRRSL